MSSDSPLSQSGSTDLQPAHVREDIPSLPPYHTTATSAIATPEEPIESLIAEMKDTRKLVQDLLRQQTEFQEKHAVVAEELRREFGEINTSYDSLSKMAAFVHADAHTFVQRLMTVEQLVITIVSLPEDCYPLIDVPPLPAIIPTACDVHLPPTYVPAEIDVDALRPNCHPTSSDGVQSTEFTFSKDPSQRLAQLLQAADDTRIEVERAAKGVRKAEEITEAFANGTEQYPESFWTRHERATKKICRNGRKFKHMAQELETWETWLRGERPATPSIHDEKISSPLPPSPPIKMHHYGAADSSVSIEVRPPTPPIGKQHRLSRRELCSTSGASTSTSIPSSSSEYEDDEAELISDTESICDGDLGEDEDEDVTYVGRTFSSRSPRLPPWLNVVGGSPRPLPPIIPPMTPPFFPSDKHALIGPGVSGRVSPIETGTSSRKRSREEDNDEDPGVKTECTASPSSLKRRRIDSS